MITEDEIILQQLLKIFALYDASFFVTMHGDIELERKGKDNMPLPRNKYEAKEIIKELKLRQNKEEASGYGR